MTVVDVSQMSATLFILNIVFLLLIFGFLSFGILSMFQQKFRRGWYSFASAIIFAVTFGVILNVYFV